MKNYSVNEAAAELGVSPSLVYQLLERRKIRHERHGLGRGRIVIPADALAEYRTGRTVGVGEAPPPAQKLKHLSLS